ncbi:hypothetical protein CTEN210_05760 [Chaetoceros tenuissimus]|uniref:Uncharacterized protein n=1 Tax=Chaetoceros tenuissimus TaxID=426638 RepID=A0AAD3CP75_9STRA|nr:hypothetical protein CTEN210_05760 [Chaetoceros tenuissimus]
MEKFTYICVCILSFIRLHSAFARELGVCVDDEDFYFASFEFSTSDGEHVKQTCSWISDRKECMDQLCSIKTVQRACPMTCKTCSNEDVLNEHAQDNSSSSLGAPLNKSASMHKYTSVVGDEQSDHDDQDDSNVFLHNGKRKYGKSGGKGYSVKSGKGKGYSSNNSKGKGSTYCYDSDGMSASHIGDFCPDSCGFCLVERNPVPSPIASPPFGAPFNNAPPIPSPQTTPTIGNPAGSPFVDACYDSSEFTFIRDNGESTKCSWLTSANTETRIERYCDRGDVKGSCKRTCNSCDCVDDEFFSFQANNGNFRSCAWISRDKVSQRRERYCFDDNGISASRIGDACVNSCGFCVNQENPTPFSFPVSSPVGTPINNSPPVPAPNGTPVSFPISTPAGTPQNVPVSTPVSSPSLVDTPVAQPNFFPISSPVNSPASQPSPSVPSIPSAPLSFPVSTPNETPSGPVSTPVSSPVSFPVSTPNETPSGPVSTPVSFPVSTPNETPSGPVSTPVSFPVSTPNETPSGPVSTPVSSPVSTPNETPSGPVSTPVSFPVSTPNETPSGPVSTPVSSPVSTPNETPSGPVSTPVSSPVSTPNETPSGPVSTPVSSPVSTPNETPSGPVSTPVSSPVSTPNETPSGPVSTPVSSPVSTPNETPNVIPTFFPTKVPSTLPTTNPSSSPTMQSSSPSATISDSPIIDTSNIPSVSMSPSSMPSKSPAPSACVSDNTLSFISTLATLGLGTSYTCVEVDTDPLNVCVELGTVLATGTTLTVFDACCGCKNVSAAPSLSAVPSGSPSVSSAPSACVSDNTLSFISTLMTIGLGPKTCAEVDTSPLTYCVELEGILDAVQGLTVFDACCGCKTCGCSTASNNPSVSMSPSSSPSVSSAPSACVSDNTLSFISTSVTLGLGNVYTCVEVDTDPLNVCVELGTVLATGTTLTVFDACCGCKNVSAAPSLSAVPSGSPSVSSAPSACVSDNSLSFISTSLTLGVGTVYTCVEVDADPLNVCVELGTVLATGTTLTVFDACCGCKNVSAAPSLSAVPSGSPSVSSAPSACVSDNSLSFISTSATLGLGTSYTCVEVDADPLNVCVELNGVLDLVQGLTVWDACCGCKNVSAAPSLSAVPSGSPSVSSAPSACVSDNSLSFISTLATLGLGTSYTCVEVDADPLNVCVELNGVLDLVQGLTVWDACCGCKNVSAAPSLSAVPSGSPSVSSAPSACVSDNTLSFISTLATLGLGTSYTCVEVDADPLNVCVELNGVLDLVQGLTVWDACCGCKNVSAAPSLSAVPSGSPSVSSAPSVCFDSPFSVTIPLLGITTCVEVALDLSLCINPTIDLITGLTAGESCCVCK